MNEFEFGLIELQPRLRRFALGLCGSLDDADDLVQQAIERALTRRNQWQVGTRLDSWLFRILQSIWFNEIDKRKVRKRHLQLVADSEANTFVGKNPPESSFELDQTRQILSTLPEDQRVALLLVAVEGFSYKEAADTLSVPAGTVMSRVGRARATIRDRLGAASIPQRAASGQQNGSPRRPNYECS